MEVVYKRLDYRTLDQQRCADDYPHLLYKPALLRQLFELGCSYSGELLSLNKMLGQLQNAGLPAFQKLFHPQRVFVVGSGGVSIEDFLQADLSKLF